ncbi:MAG: hypothetical protein AAF985_22970 [Bacteroidota bacterium]
MIRAFEKSYFQLPSIASSKTSLMGFSGSRIPGHSGSDFKHRKAFVRQNEYYRKQGKAQNSKTNTEEQGQDPISETRSFEPSKAEQWIKYGIGLPAIILTSAGILYALFFYGDLVSLGLNKDPQQYAKEVKEKQLRQKAIKDDAYRVNVGTGNYYLQNNQLKAAQTEYTRALQIDKYGETARIGLAIVLLKRCQREGVLCYEIAEQLTFIQEMNFLSPKEIEDLKKQYNYFLKH